MLRFAITPGSRTAASAVDRAHLASILQRARELAEDGVDFLLLREKHLAARELEALSQAVVQAVQGSTLAIVVPADPAIARASGAAGVHLSGAAAAENLARVRREWPEAWISVSCHSAQEIVTARENGADAALFAPVFGKWLGGAEVVPGVGLDALREACRLAGTMPVFALGGISRKNVAACLEAGAAGIAGIRLFFGEASSP